MQNFKKLIVYYSLDGSTDFVAKIIAKKTEANLLRLKPIKDLNPKSMFKVFWGGKQVLTKTKPELEPFYKNPNNYDLIFIGTPCWAFTYAPALASFFEKNKIENKKVALYCCHGGNPKDTIEKMKKQLPNNEFISEKLFQEPIKNQKKGQQEAEEWINQITNIKF